MKHFTPCVYLGEAKNAPPIERFYQLRRLAPHRPAAEAVGFTQVPLAILWARRASRVD